MRPDVMHWWKRANGQVGMSSKNRTVVAEAWARLARRLESGAKKICRIQAVGNDQVVSLGGEVGQNAPKREGGGGRSGGNGGTGSGVAASPVKEKRAMTLSARNGSDRERGKVSKDRRNYRRRSGATGPPGIKRGLGTGKCRQNKGKGKWAQTGKPKGGKIRQQMERGALSQGWGNQKD